jgi:hypothetical protein
MLSPAALAVEQRERRVDDRVARERLALARGRSRLRRHGGSGAPAFDSNTVLR